MGVLEAVAWAGLSFHHNAYLANDASRAGDSSVPLAAGSSSKRLAAKAPHGSK